MTNCIQYIDAYLHNNNNNNKKIVMGYHLFFSHQYRFYLLLVFFFFFAGCLPFTKITVGLFHRSTGHSSCINHWCTGGPWDL